MNNLEFTKYNYNFKFMKRRNEKYGNEDFFPKDVNFKEMEGDPVDYKEEIFDIYP